MRTFTIILTLNVKIDFIIHAIILYNKLKMMSVQNPIMPTVLQYSPYIPQQTDIENNVRTNISLEIHNLEEKITLLNVRLNTNDEKIEKLRMDLYEVLNTKICDCCCNIGFIVLFVVIYVKVYA